MKKILTLILIFSSCWVSAQLSNAKVSRIQDANTAFGFNIPKGDIIFDVTNQRFYGVILARTSAEKISDLTAGTHYKELTNETLKAVDDNTTNSTMYPLWTTGAGQVVPKVSTTKFTLNPSTGLVSTGNYGSSANWYTAYGWGNHATAGYLTSVTNISGNAGTVTTSNYYVGTEVYPIWTSANGSSTLKTSSMDLKYSPATGWLSAKGFTAPILSLTTATPQIYLNSSAGSSGQVLTSGGSGGAAYWENSGGGSMVYPGAGIPISTGSAWGTSITNNSANWNTAYSWGDHASAGYVTGTPWTSAFTNSGAITATNFILSSDTTLKRNIQKLDQVDYMPSKDIEFVKYYFKKDSTNQLRYGVSAQQVKKIMPDVTYVDANGKLGVAYIDMLIAIVAQQRQEIESLKQRTTDIEKIVNRLIDSK